MRYILALDEGTTSARAVVYDTFEDKIIAQAHQEFKLIYKQSGWVEADAVQIYAAQVAALNEVIAQSDIDLKNVYGIGVTNQRETVVVWDRVTGAPLYNAIIWQCRRTAKYCETLSEDKQLCESIQLKTGLRIDAYFSATKIKWLLDNVSGLKMRAERGEVLIGTIDSYIIYRLSRGKCFVTDMSNASRTMLFNIHTKMWDKDLLQLFGIPLCALPRVIGSDEKAGKTAILNRDIDICGIAGDQQAALFGQTCFKEGDAKNTYGTGCFILINSGKIPKVSVNSLLTTIAWKIKGEVTYAYEGSVFNAGSAVQWLRDKMDFFKQSSD
ncbi:MAG: FGGY family carbohydrate kinase, partial [Clostridia bacterium]